MKKYLNHDILKVLKKAVDENTEAYKNDLNFDKALLRLAAIRPTGENDRFLWLSRQNGTVCLQEREVYIKESGAYDVWQYYANQKGENEKFIAYAIEITGLKDERVVGNLHEFDFLKHVEEVKKTDFRSQGIEVRFEDGTELNIPYKEFYREWDNLNFEHGKVEYHKHLPYNEKELQATLNAARAKREKECRTSVAKAKPQEQKLSIRDQLAAGKREIAARVTNPATQKRMEATL